jgi:uncharacterized RDD family membrane protein YckC
MTVGRQGNYAGAASRLIAYAIDVGASWGIYLLGTAGLNFAVKLVSGHSYTLTNHPLAGGIVFFVWEFIYFSYQWAVSGKTIGMAIFGIQVVTRRGGPISPGQAALRTIGLALTLLTLGIGFLGIVFQRERRALDDYVAKTAVVYDWDARAAHLRWLARKEGTAHHGLSHQRSLAPPPPGQTSRPSEPPTSAPPEHVST